jgi:hypothetical protein
VQYKRSTVQCRCGTGSLCQASKPRAHDGHQLAYPSQSGCVQGRSDTYTSMAGFDRVLSPLITARCS